MTSTFEDKYGLQLESHTGKWKRIDKILIETEIQRKLKGKRIVGLGPLIQDATDMWVERGEKRCIHNYYRESFREECSWRLGNESEG
jgi:hypothetical protein